MTNWCLLIANHEECEEIKTHKRIKTVQFTKPINWEVEFTPSRFSENLYVIPNRFTEELNI